MPIFEEEKVLFEFRIKKEKSLMKYYFKTIILSPASKSIYI